MSEPGHARPGARFLFSSAWALLALCCAARAADTTAVSSRTSEDYSRIQTLDRRYRQETYALGVGGDYGSGERDVDAEKVKFTDVVRAIAGPLAEQDYVSTKDPNKTQLLIMVYWGTTTGSGEPTSMSWRPDTTPTEIKNAISPSAVVQENARPPGEGEFSAVQEGTDASEIFNRGAADFKNAAILGYDSGLIVPDSAGITPMHITRDDLLDEVRHNRYFVVLMAYDFQKLWKLKQHKLVWETRFSVRQQDNDFSRILPSMARYASQFFGKDTFGLIRRPLPEGNVEVGIPQAVASLQDSAAPAPVTALDGGSSVLESQAQKWMSSTLPPELERRIDAYKKDRAALMQDLASRLAAKTWDDSHRVVDAFNTENASRIAMLSRAAQGIRTDLA
ncbi:MAG TPA: hypothetical protein VIJ19_06170, partial [Opitutaceae bacterium]